MGLGFDTGTQGALASVGTSEGLTGTNVRVGGKDVTARGASPGSLPHHSLSTAQAPALPPATMTGGAAVAAVSVMTARSECEPQTLRARVLERNLIQATTAYTDVFLPPQHGGSRRATWCARRPPSTWTPTQRSGARECPIHSDATPFHLDAHACRSCVCSLSLHVPCVAAELLVAAQCLILPSYNNVGTPSARARTRPTAPSSTSRSVRASSLRRSPPASPTRRSPSGAQPNYSTCSLAGLCTAMQSAVNNLLPPYQLSAIPQMPYA